ncbi:Aminotransferase [Thalictrum thalictroides]|uniref:Aminotransferase n=1 Tax=Thalictrum thalictroides TaxID=46969 RepID=A0A7J6VKR7_THATH|nr:Aminotransferase [Thalictrum thalictroides]
MGDIQKNMSEPVMFFTESKPKTQKNSVYGDTNSPSSDDHSLNDEDFNLRAVSFRLQKGGIDLQSGLSIQEKCTWLRSQLIGDHVEFETPFGKRQLSYADHTASGRSLHHIENFIIENVYPFYGNTHTDDSFVGRRTTKMVHEATAYIKKCLGGGSEDALLFCGSGTTAAIKRLQEVMGISVPSIMRSRVMELRRPEERWVVFVGPYEHHSNLLSWRQSLAEVVEIGLNEDGLIDMEMLRNELKSSKYANRPMLGSFSACSNVTGILSDTRGLARLLCFDFAASAPYVQIDLRSGELEGYDAIFLSPHKFVGGPGTPGILLMNKSLYHLKSSAPSTCGGGTVSFVNGFSEQDTLYYDDIEEREDAGTPPIVQKIRAALAFWVKEYMGNHLIETQENLWIDRALKRLLPNPNIHVLGNTSVKRQPILSFLIYTTSLDHEKEGKDHSGYMWRERATRKDKPLHARFVTKLLNDLFGIQARGGCACAAPYGHSLLNVGKEQSLAFRAAIEKGFNGIKPGWTRLSFIYYMSIIEFEFILAAIEFIALYGQRFLPLYHFNWKTGDWTFKKKVLKVVEGGKNVLKIINSSNAGCMQPVGDNAYTHMNHIDTGSSASSRDMEQKYTMYLETARNIAQCLPKYPSQRKIPEGVDPDLVTFFI